MSSQIRNEVILVCQNLKNKNIINKFFSLKKEFFNINFSIILHQDDHSYDDIVTFLPSWIIEIDGIQDIVEGDVLITPLRSLIKEKIKKGKLCQAKMKQKQNL